MSEAKFNYNRQARLCNNARRRLKVNALEECSICNQRVKKKRMGLHKTRFHPKTATAAVLKERSLIAIAG